MKARRGSFRSGFAREAPDGTALLAIHAINPYGFAWMRRVTEENVDLNRNFVAHDRTLPANAGYDELAEAICPREWNASARAAVFRRALPGALAAELAEVVAAWRR